MCIRDRWDLASSRLDALRSRKDLNDPHAAALWDLASSRLDALQSRKDLNEPHAAALWDLASSRLDALRSRKDLNESTRCRAVGFGELQFTLKPKLKACEE